MIQKLINFSGGAIGAQLEEEGRGGEAGQDRQNSVQMPPRGRQGGGSQGRDGGKGNTIL